MTAPTTTLAGWLMLQIVGDEAALSVPEFEEDADSARGPGWGTRTCLVCAHESWGGTESVTEEDWYAHADAMHDRNRRLLTLRAHRQIIESERLRVVGTPTTYVRREVYDAIAARLDTPVLRALADIYADRDGFVPRDQEWPGAFASWMP